jgi:hypothetical protein
MKHLTRLFIVNAICYLALAMVACGQQPVAGPLPASTKPTAAITPRPVGATLVTRIAPPPGCVRQPLDTASFGHYLRHLPLKPPGSPVLCYDGSPKSRQDVHVAVVNLPIGTRDLHQCADAVMRLRAEYLYRQRRYTDIQFNLTNGFPVNYGEWMKGKRVAVSGNTTRWVSSAAPSNTPADLWRYLELVFSYAGTASLAKELITKPISMLEIGDVLIQGGFPGHAVIVADIAVNPVTGDTYCLLAQSYMPAQEIHILRNPGAADISPWYQLPESGRIQTPEWSFEARDLKKFP